MDLRTGKMYDSVEAARADGVPESDIAHVVLPKHNGETLRPEPRVTFPKGPFKSLKNAALTR